ncbi:MAG: hypothetical protein AAF438_04965 [Pseudomonadota bacterium]
MTGISIQKKIHRSAVLICQLADTYQKLMRTHSDMGTQWFEYIGDSPASEYSVTATFINTIHQRADEILDCCQDLTDDEERPDE